MGRPVKYKAGDVINGTKVLRYIGRTKGDSHYAFECKYCGKEFITELQSIRTQHTQSCGCKSIELMTEKRTIHGHSTVENKSSEYTSWQNMHARCYNENKEYHYSLYGAKGVVVCERWHDFRNFLVDMGLKPTKKHSIDRFPNKKGNYSCGKCEECIRNGWQFNARWATQKQQLSNRSNTITAVYMGQVKAVTIWHEELKLPVPAKIVCQRIKKGWEVYEAFYTPIRGDRVKAPRVSNFINHSFGHFNTKYV